MRVIDAQPHMPLAVLESSALAISALKCSCCIQAFSLVGETVRGREIRKGGPYHNADSDESWHSLICVLHTHLARSVTCTAMMNISRRLKMHLAEPSAVSKRGAHSENCLSLYKAEVLLKGRPYLPVNLDDVDHHERPCQYKRRASTVDGDASCTTSSLFSAWQKQDASHLLAPWPKASRHHHNMFLQTQCFYTPCRQSDAGVEDLKMPK